MSQLDRIEQRLEELAAMLEELLSRLENVEDDDVFSSERDQTQPL